MDSRKCVKKICKRLELRDEVPKDYIGTKEELYLGHGIRVVAEVTNVRYSDILKTNIVEFTWNANEKYTKLD